MSHPLDTLTLEEAAAYLKCGVNTAMMLAGSGELPCAQIGRSYVFLRAHLGTNVPCRTLRTPPHSPAHAGSFLP